MRSSSGTTLATPFEKLARPLSIAAHELEAAVGVAHRDAALGDAGIDAGTSDLRADMQEARLGLFETAHRFVEPSRAQRHASENKRQKPR